MKMPAQYKAKTKAKATKRQGKSATTGRKVRNAAAGKRKSKSTAYG